MGETKTPHFYDFGICGRVPEPPTPVIVIFEGTRTPKESQKQTWGILKNIMFHKSQNSGTSEVFDDFGKDRRRTIPTICLIAS